ncbi:MAG: cyclic pyranopterin monophosphate synthase MoaC, partial [Candidatus Methanofastidiosa archaeon]|nr:cyclic pyranopterin monophosphate synthase MoaC [Candidatus Methanofastidiosa archaeon]
MFSHLSDKGVKMVDITSKEVTVRIAVAEGEIKLKKET